MFAFTFSGNYVILYLIFFFIVILASSIGRFTKLYSDGTNLEKITFICVALWNASDVCSINEEHALEAVYKYVIGL